MTRNEHALHIGKNFKISYRDYDGTVLNAIVKPIANDDYEVFIKEKGVLFIVLKMKMVPYHADSTAMAIRIGWMESVKRWQKRSWKTNRLEFISILKIRIKQIKQILDFKTLTSPEYATHFSLN
jgi:hypothetical protein